MNRLALPALWALVAVLVGTIGYELSDRVPAEQPEMVATPASDDTATPAGSASPVPGQVAAWAATSLARPLFSPNRRPAAVAETALMAPPETTMLPRLTAILVTPGEKSAIFAGPEGGRPLVLREGGRIGRFAVTSIDQQQVILMDGNGTRVLRTGFDPSTSTSRAGGPPVAAAPAIPSVARAAGAVAPPLGTLSTPPPSPSSLSFERIPAPSGLDILLNLNRSGTTAATRP